MLSKISKISSDAPAQGGGSGFYYPFRKKMEKKNTNLIVDDHANISPALNFLSNFKWILNELSFPDENNVALDFTIENIRFKTHINYINFLTEPRFNYTLLSELTTNDVVSKILVNVSVQKNPAQFLQYYNLIPLQATQVLLERIHNLNVENQITKYDIDVLQELLDGIESDIKNEFEFINNTIYTLIEKLGTLGLKENHIFYSVSEENIIIEKILKV